MIYLSDNQISSIDASVFSGLDRLLVIEMALNKIKYVYPKLFHGLVNLQVIDLTYNMISAIEAKTFKELPNLVYLKLACNPIMTVDGKIVCSFRNTDFNETDNIYPVDKVAAELCTKLPTNLNIYIGYQHFTELF